MDTADSDEHQMTPPSLRARLLRTLLGAVVDVLGRLRGGVPASDDDVGLEAYGFALREQLDRIGAVVPLPAHVSCEPSDDSAVPGLWITDRRVARPGRAMLYLHGGGYVAGSPSTHRRLAASLSSTTRSPVFLPRYRLAPEHPFPAALDDVARALDHLVTRGVPPARIAIGGDSAGGGLALAALLRRRDAGAELPAAYVGFAPWVELSGVAVSHRLPRVRDPMLTAELVAPAGRSYAGDWPVDHPLVSPVNGDLRGLPPMLVHVGADDVLLQDARVLVERARAAGVDAALGVFPGMWHIFQVFPIPEARRSVREAGGFVRRHLEAAG